MTWTQSAPPAVAGGYIVDALDLLMFCEPNPLPTRSRRWYCPDPSMFLDFEAKPKSVPPAVAGGYVVDSSEARRLCLKSPGFEISLCNLCVLCVSVVCFC